MKCKISVYIFSQSILIPSNMINPAAGPRPGICLINIAPDSSVKICQETAPSSVSRQLSALSACDACQTQAHHHT